jgi:hypothetical protein
MVKWYDSTVLLYGCPAGFLFHAKEFTLFALMAPARKVPAAKILYLPVVDILLKYKYGSLTRARNF